MKLEILSKGPAEGWLRCSLSLFGLSAIVAPRFIPAIRLRLSASRNCCNRGRGSKCQDLSFKHVLNLCISTKSRHDPQLLQRENASSTNAELVCHVAKVREAPPPRCFCGLPLGLRLHAPARTKQHNENSPISLHCSELNENIIAVGVHCNAPALKSALNCIW